MILLYWCLEKNSRNYWKPSRIRSPQQKPTTTTNDFTLLYWIISVYHFITLYYITVLYFTESFRPHFVRSHEWFWQHGGKIDSAFNQFNLYFQRHVVTTAERLRGEDERDKKKRKPTLKPTDWLRSFFWGKQTSQELHFSTPLSRLGLFLLFHLLHQ